jgi:hypothetical protein
MSTREIPGERERVEVRPGVWLWLSGPDLAAFRAKQPAPPAPITAAVVVPENAAMPPVWPHQATSHPAAKPNRKPARRR